MKTLIGVFCLVLLAGCNSEDIDGNGHLVEEIRQVRDFRGIRVENGLDVRAALGEKSLVLRIDDNLLGYIQTSVEGGDLVLRTKDGVSLDPSSGSQIRVSAPIIEFVNLSEGSDLDGEIGGDEQGYVSIEASSGSDADLTVHAGGVDAEVSGGSDLELFGSARELFVSASGGSDVESELPTELLQVDASGGSDVNARASVSATVSATGGSDVTVFGTPEERKVDSSGGSDVAFAD